MESPKQPRAELISWTINPIETIYCIWMKSKNPNFIQTPDSIAKSTNQDLKNRVVDTFKKVISQNIPVGENIDFVFMLHDDPISHREQMVRHRIGVHYGDNFGVDVIPDLADSTWWSQSMRILDMSKFAENGNYFIPETVKDKGLEKEYAQTMLSIQSAYSFFLKKGIPMEDARNLLPLGTTMDISWKVNLTSLIHIIGKRSCWILQYGLWGYIIDSMIKELVDKVDPIFEDLSLPPCFKEGEFHNCVFKHENERRVDGSDHLPVCPLYFGNHMKYEDRSEYIKVIDSDLKEMMGKLIEKYELLWNNRNAFTGLKKG